jgi:hypothetical protein
VKSGSRPTSAKSVSPTFLSDQILAQKQTLDLCGLSRRITPHTPFLAAQRWNEHADAVIFKLADFDIPLAPAFYIDLLAASLASRTRLIVRTALSLASHTLLEK